MAGDLHIAFLGLGSNLGDRELNLRQARQSLTGDEVRILKVSPIYETEPVDWEAQNWFLNQAASVDTSLSPGDLLNYCLHIEDKMGRRRSIPKGPRNIDIDILLYDDQVIEESQLIVPHPRLHLRQFVLVALAAIAPSLVHPRLNLSMASLLKHCPDKSRVTELK